MTDLDLKILKYKAAAEDMLRSKGVTIYDGTQPKEKWKKFILLSSYPDSPQPGYGLVDTEIPVEEILVDVTESVDVLLKSPDVTIAHASVQVYADLLTGCVYDVRIGVTIVPTEKTLASLESNLN